MCLCEAYAIRLHRGLVWRSDTTTGATVSVLNEETWRKCGHVSKVNPVTGTLTTANGNELTVLEETKVRFLVGNIDCFWPVMVAYLARTFSSTLAVKFTMTLELL